MELWLLHSHPGCSLPALALRSVPNLLLCPFFMALSQHGVGKREKHRRSPCEAAKGEFCFIALHLSPGAMCSVLSLQRSKKTCAQIEENRNKRLVQIPARATEQSSVQLVLLDVSTGSAEKGIKMNPKDKNNCKVLGGELPVFNPFLMMHPGWSWSDQHSPETLLDFKN